MRIASLLAHSACAAFALSCSSGTDSLYTIADSAGVLVVNNRPGAQQRWVRIRIDSVPLFDVGGASDEPDLQFHQIVGATRLSDSRIVVANRSTSNVRYFGPRGTLLRVVGGPGEGPGRFRSLARLWRGQGDTVFVYDDALARLSKIDPTGEFVASYNIALANRRPRVVGALNDTLLLGYWRLPFSPEVRQGGVTRDSVFLVPLTLTGAPAGDSIGPLASGEYVLLPLRNGMSVATRAFGKGLRTAIADNRIAVGTQDTFIVSIYSFAGDLIRSVRLLRANPVVDESDIARYKKDWIGDIHDPRQAPHDFELMNAMTYPHEWPAHGSIEFDAIGNLWVRRPTTYRDSQPAWEVFDASGVWLGSAAVPLRFGVFEIGRDYILGRWRDQDDVEHVRLYELRR